MADTKWSQFPSATPGNSDQVVGLHSGDNARFTIANIIAAVRQGLENIFVPLTRTINGKALNNDISLNASDVGAVATSAVGAADGVASLDSNGKVPGTQLDLSGKQDEITASGILKGDGAGGVSAAVAGTDYQAPLTAGTDYATPGMIPSVPIPSDSTPQNLGTAAAGISSAYSRADHIHQKPTYSKADVGLGNVENERQYSSNNPPPYPVTYISVTFNCDSSGRHTFSNGELPNRALSSPVGCLAKDASNNYLNAGTFDINPRYTTAGTFVSSSCANKEVTLFFAVYN